MSLPWNLAVIPLDGWNENRSVEADIYPGWKYGFGLVPFWRLYPYPFVGWASFECIRTEERESLPQSFEKGSRFAGAVRREFHAGNTRILCWEFQQTPDDGNPFQCYVNCITPIEEKGRAFRARFIGPKEALPEFYDMIRSMKPVN